MLTLRHLTIFQAVSQTGNFTKAAHSLYITQSAVSHTIRELEEYAGCPLFDRLPKQVRLTAAGRALLGEAAPILASCAELDQRIKRLDQCAPLRLVSSITIACYWLPRKLQELKRILPGAPVTVTVVSAAEAVSALREGQADLGLIEGAEPPGPFAGKRFSTYDLALVCAPDHPAAGRVLSPGQLCAEDLLLREAGSAIRDTLDSQLYLLGHRATARWTSVNSAALKEAAKAGLGIAVLPQALVDGDLRQGALARVRVEGLTLKNDMIAIWHRGQAVSPSCAALLELM